VFTVSLSNTLTVHITVIALSLILFILASYGRVMEELKNVVKPILFITALTLVVSLPLIIVNPYNVEVLRFITRVIASTTAFVLILRIIGWRNILYGLRGLKAPSNLVWMISCTIKFIPLFLNEVLRMLLAREARILRKQPLSNIWKLLAAIVSETIIRAHYRSWRFNFALEARSLGKTVDLKYSSSSNSLWNVVLLTSAIYVVLLEITARSWGII